MKLRLFGGKGGVGKTTCAAAWSLAAAEGRDASVLVLSVDPAHSLGDALGLRLTSKPTRVKTRRGRLAALEIDAPSSLATWLKSRRPALARTIERGTFLDDEDVRRMLALPLPGLDELAAFLAMIALERAREYDEIVVDTAPGGHTRRLLEVPRVVGALADVLQAMHARHAIVAGALGGAVGPDALVEELRADAEAIDRRLHDPSSCSITWMTVPEAVAIEETIDGIDWLRRGGFSVDSVVVNRLTPRPKNGCAECRARASYERAALGPLLARVKPLVVRTIDHQPAEPRGSSSLRRMAPEKWDSPTFCGDKWDSPTFLEGKRSRFQQKQGSSGLQKWDCPTFADGDTLRLLLFGGKGGVGKSTCAAAVALAAAAANPQRRVRLISTDPAPSLGDVLEMDIGDAWREIPGRWRLQVRELDAAAVFDTYRQQHQQAVSDFFDRIAGGSTMDAAADREIFERIFDLAPPGIDELVALLSVADVASAPRGQVLVVDTAPTGHTLRFLAMRDDLQQWLALLMRLIMKYRLTARAESVAHDLVALSRGLRGFRAFLSDSTRSRFVTVVRPAALPRLETARLLAELARMNIPAPTLIVNAETRGTCAACRRRAKGEREEVARIRRLCRARSRRCDIMHAPLRVPPPQGAGALLDWQRAWRADASRRRARGVTKRR